MRGLFITGTSTGVGKTHVGAILAHKLVRIYGPHIGVYKPVESGCQRKGETLFAADAQRLWEAAGMPGDKLKVCPQRFEAALAPPQAAALKGTEVDASLLRTGLEYWRDTSDFVLVEGAGGLMSPLSDQDYNLDLAADLGLPLMIVAANELGVINATMQTIITARSLAPQLPIAGIVLNQATDGADDESISSNAAQLQKHCDAPLLATVGFGQDYFDELVPWLGISWN